LGTSYAVRFVNDASNNTLKYCKINSRNNSTTSGTIVFSTTTGTTGNDNNTIDYCDIYDGSSTPFNGIYASGTTTSTAHNNSGNIISNCNIYNFFNAGGSDNGIIISSGNTDWTITGNSFYQTASRTMTTGATDAAISISNTSGNNFVVTNNYIGGSEASSGGTAWTIAGSVANRFRGISLSVGSTTPSSIQGNTIANFNFTSNSSASTSGGAWTGIILTSGNANIGSVSGNTIGSGTGTGSISVTMVSNSGGVSSGIWSDAFAGVTISNNTIGSMSQASSTIGAGLIGIAVTLGTTVTISNNTVGSTSTANSFNTAAYTGATVVAVTGIRNTSSATVSITNNTVANLNNGEIPSSAASSNLVMGISSSSGTNTITGNTVRNLSTAAQATGTASAASVIGISMTATSAGATLAQNSIYALSNSHASAAVSVIGIHYGGPTTGTNVVARNLIYGLNIVSTSATADMRGINFASGLANVQNNMIRLGFDAAGTALTTGFQITGLFDVTSTANTGMYHNSIYIGGSGVGTQTGDTYAFRSNQTTNIRTYQNNIFVNARSNSTTGGKHYAVRVSGTGANPTGLAINYNVYHVTGTGGVFGWYNEDRADIAAWKTATGQDGNSGFADPNFVAPTAATPDLHIANPTPIEGQGIVVAAITDDFDGESRAGLTPVDIGADAGNFTLIDIFAPVISYTALANTASTGNRNLVVTVTDASGVPTTAPGWPNLYWRIGAGSWTAATPTGVTGSNYTYSFGAGVVTGDVVQYYVVAQDNASTPNVGAFPSAGAGGFTTNPPAAATPPTTPSSYTIVGALSGTYSVGAGQDYATLTAAITDLNGKEVTGPVTFELWDATYPAETFPIIIQKPARANPTDLVTIKPKSGVSSAISGSSATGILVLMGADYIVIDGSNSGGTDRSLTWENTSTAASSYVIGLFHNGTVGASNSTIKNNIAKAGSKIAATTWAIVLNASGGGYNNITIQNNEILNAYVGLQFAGIVGNAATNGLITQNVFGSDDNALTLGNNALNTSNVTGLTISNNSIKNLQTGNNPMGMWLSTNTQNTNVIANSISKIYYTGTGGYGGKGIVVNSALPASNILIANNVISDLRGDGWSSLLSDAIVGIRVGAHAGSATTTGGVNIYYNSVNLGSGTFAGNTSGTASAALYLGASTTNIDVRNNVFANNLVNSNAAGAKAYAINSAAATIATINYNDYYASGTQGVLGFLGSDRVDLAAWQGATTQDANSLAVDPQFVSETNLQPFTGSPVLAAGTPIVGVTTDFTGASRSGTTPSMGAYESGQASAAVGWANLQWPPTATITEGQTFTAYARVWQDGVTNTPGPGVGIESWFGWNAADTDPATWTNWISGTYNEDYGNDDEWMADIGAGITPGTYYYASRFRTTGGTYQYGGYSGGFWNGTTNVSGVLTVNPFTVTSLPWYESFETQWIPTGWANSNWDNSKYGGARTGTKWAFSNTTGSLLTTPGVVIPASGNYQFSFWHRNESASYPQNLNVFLSTNGVDFTVPVATIVGAASTTYTQVTFDLSAYNGQTVYFRFNGLSGAGGFDYGICVDDVEVKPTATTWLGASNTAWDNAANWSNGVPVGVQNAIIGVSANNPVLGSAGAANNLTIDNGAILNVTNGGQLTVNGVLTNSAGNGGLVLQSNASGTGSLIHNTDNVPATIKRYITGGQYHFASVPLTAAANPTADVFLHSYLWRYDPTLPDWVKYTAETDPLTVTQGYMLWYTGGNTTYSFAGNMNNGAFTAATPGGAGTFNLVPNPYPSAIDWNAASGWTKTNVANATYIYNSTQYASYVAGVGANGGTNIIPGGQAFFVQATGAAALAMNNNVRTHSGQAFFNEPVINDLFRIAVSVDGKSDETVVRFTGSATASFDSEYDAAKLYGNASAPQLYTMAADNQMLSINSLAMTEGGVSVPLSFEFTADGEITLQFSGVGSFSELQAIFIEDQLTGSMTDLRQHGSYSFNHLVSNDPDRFLLHFRDITGVDEQGNGWMIFANDRKVYVNIPELNGQRAGIEMFDVLGNKLFSSEGVMNSPAVVRAANSGVAIVRVTAQGRVYTTKLFIQ
jgi:hypothetical protein